MIAQTPAGLSPAGVCASGQHPAWRVERAASQQEQGARAMDVKDSNGAILADGDNVTLIKDLKVKGTSTTLKRGTMVRGIRLTDNPDEVECRVEKIKGLVLRTEFLKKA
jgi:alkylphosphonate utilization operon protein PhnA